MACIASSQQPMQFDICIANILRGPLLDLQPRLTAYVKPGGHLLLSGILVSQVRLTAYVKPGGHLLLSGILDSQVRLTA